MNNAALFGRPRSISILKMIKESPWLHATIHAAELDSMGSALDMIEFTGNLMEGQALAQNLQEAYSEGAFSGRVNLNVLRTDMQILMDRQGGMPVVALFKKDQKKFDAFKSNLADIYNETNKAAKSTESLRNLREKAHQEYMVSQNALSQMPLHVADGTIVRQAKIDSRSLDERAADQRFAEKRVLLAAKLYAIHLAGKSSDRAVDPKAFAGFVNKLKVAQILDPLKMRSLRDMTVEVRTGPQPDRPLNIAPRQTPAPEK